MADERNRSMELPHHIIIEGRKRLSISGVEDVESFDESSVLCTTSKGVLLIKGSDLHIDKLSIEGGDLSIEGTIDSLDYEAEENRRGGFWSRMFS